MTISNSHQTLLFTGSYAEKDSPGIGVYQFHQERGELKLLDEASGIKNPTFLNVDISARRLYAIGEISVQGQKAAEIVTFAVDPELGKLQELSRVQSVGSSTCHIQRDAESKFLIVSSYHGGLIGLHAIQDDGTPGPLLDEKRHAELVQVADGQQPRAHSAFYSPDEQYLFVQDLGLDKIMAYTVDADAKKLSFHGETQLAQGAGPRHLTFHPRGVYAYVINELDSTVTVLRYNRDQGSLETVETVSTLPPDYKGESYCAEIAISTDGKTLYGSNRGHDSIVVYRVDQNTGKLTPLQYMPTGGGHPRHFSLMPGGKFLVAANRDGNNLVLFTVNPDDGLLAPSGHTVTRDKPVCVKPVVF